MKCVFFTIFLAAALMQVNSLTTSASTNSKRNSSAMQSNRLASMPSITGQTPEAIQTLDLESLISSVSKLCPRVIDSSLSYLNGLSKILPANSPLGSMIYGMQFLLENQQVLKMFDETLAELNEPKNGPTGSNGLNNAGDKTSRASDLPDSVKGPEAKKRENERIRADSVKGPEAKQIEVEQLLQETLKTLLKNINTSPVEYITKQESRRTNTDKHRGWIEHFGSDGKIWRTKNTEMIIKMVYNHDFSMIPPEDHGNTIYESADNRVYFTLDGDRTYETYVDNRRVN